MRLFNFGLSQQVLALRAVVCSLLIYSATADALIVGPIDDVNIPGGTTFSELPIGDDGTSIGRASGKNFIYTDMPLAALTSVYMVIPVGGVKGSMDGTGYLGGEVMTLVNLIGPSSSWGGNTTISSAPVGTKFDTLGTDAVSAANLSTLASSQIPGVPFGGIAYLVPTDGINLWMKMAKDTGEPFYDYFDAFQNPNPISAGTSVDWEFYYVNLPPTVSNITDKITRLETASGPHAFTVGDVEMALNSDLDNLIITASSSNTTLLPNGNITLGGTGANKTITLTPAADQWGTATVTVTVDDGHGEVATDTFELLVDNSICEVGSLTLTGLFDSIDLLDVASEHSIILQGATFQNPANLIMRAPWMRADTGFQFIATDGAIFSFTAEPVDCTVIFP